MKVTVVTSWGPKGWELYGRHFLDGFRRYMPAHFDLVVYTEGRPTLRDYPGVEERNLKAVPQFRSFVRRHRFDQQLRGLIPRSCWSAAERRKGYSFRTDALKFFRKPLALDDAATTLGESYDGYLVWFDGDTRFRDTPSQSTLRKVLPAGGEAVTYLGRAGRHSECGFLGFKLPEAREVVRTWAWAYYIDWFVELDEWHDSFVFDAVRAKLERDGACPVYRSLSRNPADGHPWLDSPLYPWSDHLKGSVRKSRGWSRTPPKKS